MLDSYRRFLDVKTMAGPHPTRRHALTARRVRFLVGIGLIAASFLVYLAYIVIILFLPFSAKTKAGAIVAASLLSWAGFSAGIFLAGHEGYHWVKRLWRRKDESPRNS